MKLIEAISIFEGKLSKGEKHFIFDCGLCENLYSIGKKFYQQKIKELVVDWKYFSGNPAYPIGGAEVYNYQQINEGRL